MLSALRGQALSGAADQLKNSTVSSIFACHLSSSAALTNNTLERKKGLLSLSEVQKILNDIGADNVKVIPAPEHCEFTDYTVIATGRSPWHVRNISQALIYKVKQKQKGEKRMLLPSVVGQEGGKWIVIDSGSLIIHAVDENARAYYNLEALWKSDTSNVDESQDLEKAFVKVWRKNNSKKRSQNTSTV